MTFIIFPTEKLLFYNNLMYQAYKLYYILNMYNKALIYDFLNIKITDIRKYLEIFILSPIKKITIDFFSEEDLRTIFQAIQSKEPLGKNKLLQNHMAKNEMPEVKEEPAEPLNKVTEVLNEIRSEELPEEMVEEALL